MEVRKKRSTKLLAWLAAIAVVFAMTLPGSVVWADTPDDDSVSGAASTVVAKIGDTEYTTLQAAVDAAGDDSSTRVTLVKDIVGINTEDIVTIPQNKDIILDMAGKSITVSENFKGRPIVNEGTLTVTGNGTIDSSASADSGYGAINNKGKLTIENGTYQGAIYANGACIRNTGENAILFVEDGTFEKATTAIYNEGKATLNGGVYSGETCSQCNKNVWGYTIRNATVNSYMTINGGTYTGVQGAVSAAIGYLEVNDGVFKSLKCKNDPNHTSIFYALYAAGEVGEVKCVINGGHFATEGKYAAVLIGNDNTNGDGGINASATGIITGGTFSAPEGVPSLKGAPKTGDPQITGGTFSSDVSQYVVAGNKQIDNQDGTYSVGIDLDKAVAEVNGVGYTTVQAAVDAIANSADKPGTIEMVNNSTGTVTIPEGTNITLNLNGKTLTVPETSEGNGFEVNGELTVSDTDGGKIVCSKKAIAVDGNAAEFVLNNGTIESENDYGIYALYGGSVIVNGGTINSLYAPLTGNNTTGNMNFEVNGGILTAEQGPAIYMPGQMNLKITDGTLNGGISLRMGQVKISGGTINAIKENIDSPKEFYNHNGNAWLPDALYVFEGTYTSGDKTYGNSLNLEITGGTFNCSNEQGSAVAIYDLGKVSQNAEVSISGNAVLKTNTKDRDAYQVLTLEDIGVETPAEGYGRDNLVGKVNTAISGGTFSSSVKEDYCANGFESIKNSDGTYTVKKETPPAPPVVVKADYSKVDAAIEKANALTKDNYKDFSNVEAAIAAVVRDKNSSAQAEVDAMAKAIEDAIAALTYKDADYSKVDEAIEKVNALNKDDYKDFSAVEAAMAAVVRDKNITQQAEVDAMAKAIEDAIAALEAAPAPAETVTKADITAGTMALNKKIKAAWSSSNLAVSWGNVSKADGYEVYAAKCGDKYTKVKTVKGNKKLNYTVKKIKGKKLDPKRAYKVCVKAYRIIDGKKKYTGTSYGIHTVGPKNKTYTNAKSVKASKKSVTLKKGKNQKVSVKITKQTSKKKLLKSSHVANLRYFSTNAKVATVTKSGTIKAAGKGSCTVYALAANGVKTTVKVTVK